MSEFSNLLTQAAWKGTVILLLGSAAALLLRRTSAAFRHFCWSVTLALLLALPAAIVFTPKWNVPLPAVATPSPLSDTALRVTGKKGPVAPAQSSSNPLPWIYSAGVLLVAARFVVGALKARRLLTGSTPIVRPGIPRRVRVMESPRAPVPMVWGILRPVIALPTAARDWTAERLRTVLLHELIHVQRRDLLAQVVAQVACCLYWFHPLAWIALRQQRRERERACDDAVLGRGIGAAEYAGHLVELVRGLTLHAPAMAEAGDFEGRVRALLDRRRNRAPLGRGIALGVSAAAVLLIVPIASLTSYAKVITAQALTASAMPDRPAVSLPAPVPTISAPPVRHAAPARGPELAMATSPAAPPEPQSSLGALAGIVADPSGGRIPGAQINIRNLDGGNQEATKSDPAGEFIFRAIPAGRYEMEIKVPGFRLGRKQAVVPANGAARADAFMELGEGSETVKVVGDKGRKSAANYVNPPQRIPIGGNVQPFKLLRQPRPEYPEDLQQQGITGTVIIRSVVGKDGRLINPQVVNTDVHVKLAKAAIDAVSNWLYEPAKLNGEPVEVLTTITIAFDLDQ